MFSLYFVLKAHIEEVKMSRRVSKLNDKMVVLTLSLQKLICKYHAYNSLNLADGVKKSMFIYVNNVVREHDNLIKCSKYKVLDKYNIDSIISDVDDLLEVIDFGCKRLLKLV